MGTIARGAKAAGGTNFSTGKGTILSGEVDNDFNTIYSDYNGNITNFNISGSAGITYGKLNLTNGLVTTDFTNLSVTGAKIADLTIAAGKLSPGAATTASGSGVFATGTSISNLVESGALATATLTTRGGNVLLGGVWNAFTSSTAATATSVYQVRVKRDGTTLATWQNNSSHALVAMPNTITVFWWDFNPAAGAHSYTVTFQWTVNADLQVFKTPTSNAGTLIALEFS